MANNKNFIRNANIRDGEEWWPETKWCVSEPKPIAKYEGMFEYRIEFQVGGYGKCGKNKFTVAEGILQKDWATQMAAAPDMLAALEQSLKAMEKVYNTELGHIVMDEIEMVQSAIAKAAGKTNA